MKKIVLFFIIVFLISSVNKANAISPGSIIKTFKGIGKFFKKGADEVPDIGKKIEDFKSGNLKSGGKIDESISSLDNTNSMQFEEGTLSQIDNGSGRATTIIRMAQPVQNQDTPFFVRLRGE